MCLIQESKIEKLSPLSSFTFYLTIKFLFTFMAPLVAIALNDIVVRKVQDPQKATSNNDSPIPAIPTILQSRRKQSKYITACQMEKNIMWLTQIDQLINTPTQCISTPTQCIFPFPPFILLPPIFIFHRSFIFLLSKITLPKKCCIRRMPEIEGRSAHLEYLTEPLWNINTKT